MKTISRFLSSGIFAFATLTTLQAADKDGVAMKDGKMMTVKDGVKAEMTGDMVLKDGTKVTSNGTVTSSDGKTWTLKDGEFIDVDGTYMTQVVKDGVIRKDGKLMKVAGGKKTEQTTEMTLTGGSKVMPDGKVTSADGKVWELDDGDAILSDGRALLEGAIIFMDGKPLLFKDCMGQPIKEEISLDGVKVRPDGAVTKKDGGEATLNEGDVIGPDGTWLAGTKAE
jgi:hypothetical protein